MWSLSFLFDKIDSGFATEQVHELNGEMHSKPHGLLGLMNAQTDLSGCHAQGSLPILVSFLQPCLYC